ncbi:MAG TPA: hypothetical protein VEH04_09720 [Verrucomicrobiae bacterium]|nr:hypothetical protein [Verrucomicrobiae bacterium]
MPVLFVMMACCVDSGSAARIQSLTLTNGTAQLVFSSTNSGTLVLYRSTTVDALTNIALMRQVSATNREIAVMIFPEHVHSFFRAEIYPDAMRPDSDGDGMDDLFELQHRLFLDPDDPADASRDENGNGVSNVAEYQRGTSPILPRPGKTFAMTGPHAAGIATNGFIFTWGLNQRGQFGNALQTYSSEYYVTGCWNETRSFNTDRGPLMARGSNWVSLATGASHTLAIKGDGTLWAWGDSNYGQLGNTNDVGGFITPGGRDISWPVPVPVGTNMRWRSVFASNWRSFAIATNGTLWGWGQNTGNVFGSNNPPVVEVPLQIGTNRNWAKVSTWGWTGSGWAVGIQNDGSLWAWGETILPRLIRERLLQTNTAVPAVDAPSPVGVPGPWLDVAAFAGVVYALKADGTLWMNRESLGNVQHVLGYPARYGACVEEFSGFGLPPEDVRSICESLHGPPPDVEGTLRRLQDDYLFDAASARSGWVSVEPNIALHSDGTVWTAGEFSPRSGDEPRDGVFQRVNSDTNWRAVAANYSGGFAAQKVDGRVHSWGPGPHNESVESTNVLLRLPGTNWLSAFKGENHVAALDARSNLWMWGANNVGQLGLGDRTARFVPTPLVKTGPWRSYVAGSSLTLAVHADGSLWGWGRFRGTTASTNRGEALPVHLVPDRQWRSVHTFARRMWAIEANGAVWGWNLGGISGDSLTAPGNQKTLVEPTLLTNVPFSKHIAGADTHTVALATNGMLFFWTATNQDAIAVNNDSWRDAAAGFNHTLAIASDGSLQAWGSYNVDAQLGIVALTAPYIHSFWSCMFAPAPNASYPAVVTTGTGTNVPTRVGSAMNWRSVVATGSSGYSAGLRTDGTLWMWGRSGVASVTNELYYTPADHLYPNIPYPNDTSVLKEPKRVGPASNWTFLSRDVAVNSAGELYMWGDNNGGQLALPPLWQPLPVTSNLVFRVTALP